MSVLLSSIEDGQKLEHDTAIAYLGYAREAYLLFDITNATAKFVEREGSAQRFVIVTKEEEETVERDGGAHRGHARVEVPVARVRIATTHPHPVMQPS